MRCGLEEADISDPAASGSSARGGNVGLNRPKRSLTRLNVGRSDGEASFISKNGLAVSSVIEHAAFGVGENATAMTGLSHEANGCNHQPVVLIEPPPPS